MLLLYELYHTISQFSSISSLSSNSQFTRSKLFLYSFYVSHTCTIIELRVCICSLKSALDLIEFVHQSVPWSRNVGLFGYRWQEEAETRFFANYRLTRNPVKPVANEPVDVLRVASRSTDFFFPVYPIWLVGHVRAVPRTPLGKLAPMQGGVKRDYESRKGWFLEKTKSRALA